VTATGTSSVGTHMPLTGPGRRRLLEDRPGHQGYFDYVNANGGVHGRKITYKIMDDGYNPANTQQVVRSSCCRTRCSRS
jgi:ABC-type branched-subunit amino acid transport system substrate-binding protein